MEVVDGRPNSEPISQETPVTDGGNGEQSSENVLPSLNDASSASALINYMGLA